MAQKKRTIVGSALTPDSLRELGAIRQFPPASHGFEPGGSWQQSYRIWTCHGYREDGNENVGALRLERTARAGGTFSLKVQQTVSQTDGLICSIEANIECRENRLASPVQWDVQTGFVAGDGGDIAELASRINGQAAADVDGTTCDWCLFELVQRLDYAKGLSLEFDLLEGLDLSKSEQRLTYHGVFPTEIEGVEHVHRFAQLGRGILPTDYWLDNRHRLLCVTSMNKAYILDDKAREAINAPAW